MTTFPTRVHGIPCQCQVLEYEPPLPMRITGTGYGDALPPEPERFSFRILDSTGYIASWLEQYLDDTDHYRLLEEYHSQSEHRDTG